MMFSFPSREITVIAVTGTKGKSSTVEFVNAIFEQAGYKTALLNSIRIKIGDDSQANVMRMSMPGRFYIQRFLRNAVNAGCAVAILEMTSEGSRQYRHRAIELDALVFTNLAPEHIESHGSYEAYADAKFEIGKQLVRSKKRPRIVVTNADDAQGVRYLELPVEYKLPFALSYGAPWQADENGGSFTFGGTEIAVKLPGEFSLKNALAAATLTRAMNVSLPNIARGIASVTRIPGRAERIETGQPFTVVVDYAHTPDSLEALYSAYGHVRKICVLGATGGGRDTWKRPVMGALADRMCDQVILTDEDPYDEDPHTIVEELARDMKRKPEILMSRRKAIARGFALARPGDAVLITGKGTDPCICRKNGEKEPWSDASVAREELAKLPRA
jgi:UDP-N-acetylmuramoyl-L-alanyl-D-glutamate--2,6-diaminopimelate ligase